MKGLHVCLCFSSVDGTRTILSSLVLRSCSVGPQMTDEANLRSEESLTVGTRYCGRRWRISGPVLSGLSSAFCSIHPTRLACLGTIVNSRPPLPQSWANVSQELWSMLKDVSDDFSVSLKRFFWPPWDCFPFCNSPNRSFFGMRSSDKRAI